MTRPRALLASLPIRVGLLLAGASIPLLAIVATGNRSIPAFILSVAFGVAAAMIGIDLVVTRPLRTLRNSVDAWRRGQSSASRTPAASPPNSAAWPFPSSAPPAPSPAARPS